MSKIKSRVIDRNRYEKKYPVVRVGKRLSLVTDQNLELEVLKGTHEKLRDWDNKGYTIIITTGRKESARPATVKQLQRAGILYDALIMGFGGGERILINDRKLNSDHDTAYAINLNRDTEGIKDLDI